MELLKVSAKSSPSLVAGALAGVIRESGNAELQAIGAGAVNQAVKAIAIASGFLVEDKITITCLPSFTEIPTEGDHPLTAISFKVDSMKHE